MIRTPCGRGGFIVRRSIAGGGNSATARIVHNHSTHAPDLLAGLAAVAEAAQQSISLIVPGRLARSKGLAPALTLTVSTPTPGGFKVLAKSRSNIQEVFMTTSLAQAELQSLLDAALASKKGRER